MASLFFDNTTPGFLLIRLSGNLIDAKRFYQTITGVIVQGKGEITKIHRFKFYAKYSIVFCYTRFKIYLY